MSESAAIAPAPLAPPARWRLLAVLVLTPLLSVALSALLVLSILHFLARVPSSAVASGVLADPRLLRDLVEPFTQKGKVPVKQYSGIVYYPVPYATPPHLTLTASANRSYTLVRQDEYGFVWVVNITLKDGKSLLGAFKDVKDLTGVAGALKSVDGKALPALAPDEAFTWEARGVRPFTTAAATPPFRQEGTFTTPASGGRGSSNEEGVEHFPHPYATPPNVTCSQPFAILVTTPTGFRWKKTYWSLDGVTVTWTARGVRATPEQVAELARQPSPLAPPATVEDSGTFSYADGEQGAVSFTRPFASEPNVEVQDVVVTEVTPRGFKWKRPGPKSVNMRTATWKARGVLDPTVRKKGETK
jgi:hypothetical protein